MSFAGRACAPRVLRHCWQAQMAGGGLQVATGAAACSRLCACSTSSVDVPSSLDEQELEIYCFLVNEMRGTELPSAITSSKVLQGLVDKFPGATHVCTRDTSTGWVLTDSGMLHHLWCRRQLVGTEGQVREVAPKPRQRLYARGLEPRASETKAVGAELPQPRPAHSAQHALSTRAERVVP